MRGTTTRKIAPDFRVFTQGVEIGTGRSFGAQRKGQVSFSFAAFEFGLRQGYPTSAGLQAKMMAVSCCDLESG